MAARGNAHYIDSSMESSSNVLHSPPATYHTIDLDIKPSPHRVNPTHGFTVLFLVCILALGIYCSQAPSNSNRTLYQAISRATWNSVAHQHGTHQSRSPLTPVSSNNIKGGHGATLNNIRDSSPPQGVLPHATVALEWDVPGQLLKPEAAPLVDEAKFQLQSPLFALVLTAIGLLVAVMVSKEYEALPRMAMTAMTDGKKEDSSAMAGMKKVMVTGGNTGIGYALCKQLAVDHDCYVYLGSRNLQRGQAAIDSLVKENPKCQGRIEMIQVDTADPASITAAAATVKAKLGGENLYALVNNAGTGLAHGVTKDDMIKTNLYGVKNMTEAFVTLIDPTVGRIVNLGSGSGPNYVKGVSNKADQDMLSKGQPTWEELEAYLNKALPKTEGMGVYGLSKALVHKYTECCAKAYPTLKINAVSPGFVKTNMTKGYGASLTPEEGTKSCRHCLFADLEGNGWYYGSDAKRSPLHYMRNPGEPVFTGY